MYGGLLYVMKNMKVKNVIIGKQFENSENLQEFTKIIKEKNIKVTIVEAGDKINIENNLYFYVLWPSVKNEIKENSINNNALVCKLYYKNFTVLFTGDIEEEAENVIWKMYENSKVLESIILKVAHHGSKSSSTEKFLKLVSPKIALIGVGKNNLYEHPSDIVINRMESFGIKIYRTDENGEISIIVNSKGNVKVREFIK